MVVPWVGGALARLGDDQDPHDLGGDSDNEQEEGAVASGHNAERAAKSIQKGVTV